MSRKYSRIFICYLFLDLMEPYLILYIGFIFEVVITNENVFVYVQRRFRYIFQIFARTFWQMRYRI